MRRNLLDYERLSVNGEKVIALEFFPKYKEE